MQRSVSLLRGFLEMEQNSGEGDVNMPQASEIIAQLRTNPKFANYLSMEFQKGRPSSPVPIAESSISSSAGRRDSSCSETVQSTDFFSRVAEQNDRNSAVSQSMQLTGMSHIPKKRPNSIKDCQGSRTLYARYKGVRLGPQKRGPDEFSKEVVLLSGPNDRTVPRQGSRQWLYKNGHIVGSMTFKKSWSEAMVRKKILEAFSDKLVDGVNFEMLAPCHNRLTKPMPGAKHGMNGLTLSVLFYNKAVYIIPSKQLLGAVMLLNQTVPSLPDNSGKKKLEKEVACHPIIPIKEEVLEEEKHFSSNSLLYNTCPENNAIYCNRLPVQESVVYNLSPGITCVPTASIIPHAIGDSRPGGELNLPKSSIQSAVDFLALPKDTGKLVIDVKCLNKLMSFVRCPTCNCAVDSQETVKGFKAGMLFSLELVCTNGHTMQ